jgi:endonuclease YncB( thermonuclease family)
MMVGIAPISTSLKLKGVGTMPDRKLAPLNYRKLVAEIVSIYDGARRSLVEAHWEIGRKIVTIEQDGASRAAYGSGLLAQLSTDLTLERGQGFSPTNLKRFRKFYQLHPKGAPAHLLTWAHHMELLSVHDQKKRLGLEKRVEGEGLSRDELRNLIRSSRGKNMRGRTRPIDVTPLVPKKGPLHTYQIVSGAEVGWPRPDVLLFDHGFRFYDEMSASESKGFNAGDIVEDRGGVLVKIKDAQKPGYSPGQVVQNLPGSTPATKPGYTYRAYLQKVIDGDTFWAALAAGWGGIARQKLRLRGIDCPEIKTPEGKAAKKFVESVLGPVESLTVFSYKNDNHDRFEADVFFVDKTGQEIFLNNLLLQTGHAVRVPGY